MDFGEVKSTLKELEIIPPNTQKINPFKEACLYVGVEFVEKKSFLLEEIINLKSLRIPCWNIGSGSLIIKGYQIEKSEPSGWVKSAKVPPVSISNKPYWLELEIDNEKIFPGKRHVVEGRVITSSVEREINNPFLLRFDIEVSYEQQARISIKSDILKKGLDLGKIPFFGEYKFTYRHKSANAVSLIGDFSDWKSIPMEKKEDSFFLWIPLKDGEYRYKFIVDGEEKLDPANPQKERDPNIGISNKIIVERYKKSLSISNLGINPLEIEISLSGGNWLILKKEFRKFQLTSSQRTKEIVLEVDLVQIMKGAILKSRLNIKSNSVENDNIEIKIYGESSLYEFLPSLSTRKLNDAEEDLMKLNQIIHLTYQKEKVKQLRNDIERVVKDQRFINICEENKELLRDKYYIGSLRILKKAIRDYPERSKEIEELVNKANDLTNNQIEELIVNHDFENAILVLKNLLTFFPDKKEEIADKINILKKDKEYFNALSEIDEIIEKEVKFEVAFERLGELINKYPDRERELALRINIVKPRVEEIIRKKDIESWIQEVEKLIAGGELEKSKEIIERVLQIDGTNDKALNLKDRIENLSKIQKLYLEAKEYSKAKEYEDSIGKLKEVLELDSKNVKANEILRDCVKEIAKKVLTDVQSFINNYEFNAVLNSVNSFREKFGIFSLHWNEFEKELKAYEEKSTILITFSSVNEDQISERERIINDYISKFGVDNVISQLKTSEEKKRTTLKHFDSIATLLTSKNFLKARMLLNSIDLDYSFIQKKKRELSKRLDYEERNFAKEKLNEVKTLLAEGRYEDIFVIIKDTTSKCTDQYYPLLNKAKNEAIQKRKIHNLLQTAKRFLLEAKESEMAISYLGEILKIQPGNKEAKTLLKNAEELSKENEFLSKVENIRSVLGKGDTENSKKMINKLEKEIESSEVLIKNRQHLDSILSGLRESLQKKEEAIDMETKYESAYALYKEEKLAESISILREILRKFPKFESGVELKRRIELKKLVAKLEKNNQAIKPQKSFEIITKINKSYKDILDRDNELEDKFDAQKEKYDEIRYLVQSLDRIQRLKKEGNVKQALNQMKAILKYYPSEFTVLSDALNLIESSLIILSKGEEKRAKEELDIQKAKGYLKKGDLEEAFKKISDLISKT